MFESKWFKLNSFKQSNVWNYIPFDEISDKVSSTDKVSVELGVCELSESEPTSLGFSNSSEKEKNVSRYNNFLFNYLPKYLQIED